MSQLTNANRGKQSKPIGLLNLLGLLKTSLRDKMQLLITSVAKPYTLDAGLLRQSLVPSYFITFTSRRKEGIRHQPIEFFRN